MRYIEWLVLFVIAACGTGLANLCLLYTSRCV